MKAWVARQEDGAIGIYARRPVLKKDEEDGEKFMYFSAADDDIMFLETPMGKDFHPEVTMDNSPLRIELTDQDLLSILRRKSERTDAHFKKRHTQTGGYMNMGEVMLMMGETYSINHLMGLIEASIADEKGGKE